MLVTIKILEKTIVSEISTTIQSHEPDGKITLHAVNCFVCSSLEMRVNRFSYQITPISVTSFPFRHSHLKHKSHSHFPIEQVPILSRSNYHLTNQPRHGTGYFVFLQNVFCTPVLSTNSRPNRHVTESKRTDDIKLKKIKCQPERMITK